MKRLSLIAAMSDNHVIGRDGNLPWHLPLDLKWFKERTMGHHLIIGRKTFESFGSRPLKGREIIVVSRSGGDDGEGVRWSASLDEALRLAEGDDEPFLGGGESIFREGLERADRMYLTHVRAEVIGDTFFPAFVDEEWNAVYREPHEPDERHEYPFTFVIYERVGDA
ncbi:MAG: dihydrofolate reductase [Acidobacteria bacterium]|nr:dihydrofolate reductase [Acidobacteriota bacterium]